MSSSSRYPRMSHGVLRQAIAKRLLPNVNNTTAGHTTPRYSFMIFAVFSSLPIFAGWSGRRSSRRRRRRRRGRATDAEPAGIVPLPRSRLTAGLRPCAPHRPPRIGVSTIPKEGITAYTWKNRRRGAPRCAAECADCISRTALCDSEETSDPAKFRHAATQGLRPRQQASTFCF